MSLEQWRQRCPDCGTRDVAVSTWQRLVEFPDIVWQHPDWPLPLEAHVCAVAAPETRETPIAPIRYRTVDT